MTTTELIKPEGRNLAEVFTTDGELDRVLAAVENAALAELPDTSTKKGRDAIASLAYKVSRSKTALDEAGKALGDDLRQRLDAINAKRRTARDRLDALRDQVRKPLDEWEAAEKRRVDRLLTRLEAINALGAPDHEAPSDGIREMLSELDGIALDDSWEEFREQAEVAIERAHINLSEALTRAVRREDEQAELERLRAAEEERQRQEAEKREREEAERREQEARERERRLQEEAAERERQRIEAERRAEQEAEARRQEEERQAEERRRADAQHREKVRQEAVAAINEVLGHTGEVRPSQKPEELASLVFDAIDRGEIPHIKVAY